MPANKMLVHLRYVDGFAEHTATISPWRTVVPTWPVKPPSCQPSMHEQLHALMQHTTC